MVRSNRLLWIAVFGISLAVATPSADSVELFHDDFNVSGDKLDLSQWTTEFGPPSFLGRTQLRDWVTAGAAGNFTVADGLAHLDLNTWNPSGFSLYGSHAKTIASFKPTVGVDIELSVRMRLTTLQQGLVFGIYFFGCDAGPCATAHDELDIELVTNFLQPGASPLRVQLNRYAAEPLGAGQGPIVPLPAGFDALADHDWKIVWGLGKVSYSVDGTVLSSATTVIPQGAMQANVIVWGPAPEWPDGYHPSLQPAPIKDADQRFGALIDSMSVQAVPEPAEWILMAVGSMALGAYTRRRQGHALHSSHAASI